LHTTPQRGSVILLLGDGKVERMNILPDHPHANPFETGAGEHRGRTLPAGV
jgi:hypothetical protein